MPPTMDLDADDLYRQYVHTSLLAEACNAVMDDLMDGVPADQRGFRPLWPLLETLPETERWGALLVLSQNNLVEFDPCYRVRATALGLAEFFITLPEGE